MNNPNQIDTSLFSLEGYCLGLIKKDNELKYLQIAVGSDKLTIKLSKTVRMSCQNILKPNHPIQVNGKTKINDKTGKTKFKAHQIILKNEEIKPPEFPAINPKIKLLLCQKSGCQKKGANQQHQAIQAMLSERGLQEQVIIKETGCLGKCSLAPNLVLMPGKQRLSGMKIDKIADLLTTVSQQT